MFARFTKRAERVVKLAQTIAREYELDYVGTEHILLAIAREGQGWGAGILLDKGLTEQSLQPALERLIKQNMEDTWVFGRLPGTPHFRNVVARAVQSADQLGCEGIGTEHLLLALLAEEGCIAHQALTQAGLSFDAVCDRVRRKLESDPQN